MYRYMKYIVIIIALAIAGTVTIVILNDKQAKTEETSMFKEAFMEGCLGEDPTSTLSAFCSCSYDALLDHYGIDGLVDLSLEYDKTGVFSNDTIKLFTKCL